MLFECFTEIYVRLFIMEDTMSYDFVFMFWNDFVLTKPSKPGHFRYYVNAVGDTKEERDRKVWSLFVEPYSESFVPSVHVEVRDGEPYVGVYPGSRVSLLPGVRDAIHDQFRKEFPAALV